MSSVSTSVGQSSVGQLILSSQRRGGGVGGLSDTSSLAALKLNAGRLSAVSAGGGAGGDGNLRGLYGQLAQKFLASRGGRSDLNASDASTAQALKDAANAAAKAGSDASDADGDTVTLSAVSTRTLAPTLRGGPRTTVGGSVGGSGATSGSSGAGASSGSASATPVPSEGSASVTAAIPVEDDPGASVEGGGKGEEPEAAEPAAPAGPTAAEQAAELVTASDVQDAGSLNATRAVVAEVIASGGQVARTSRGRYEFVLGDTKGELRGDQSTTRLDLTFTNAGTGQQTSARVLIRGDSDVRVASASNSTARTLAQNFAGRVLERAQALTAQAVPSGGSSLLGTTVNVVV